MARIAINGFGRIGRLVFRNILQQKDANLNVVAINDLTKPSVLGHLLKYDSAHGSLKAKVHADENNLYVNEQKIPIYAQTNPTLLPWKAEKIDLVIETSGRFTDKNKAQEHLKCGAKKVVISAPAQGGVKTIVYNVNHKELTRQDDIVSAASCTTNCLAPLVYYLDLHFGIEWGFMTTTHSYTADQRIQDGPHSDLRRARAAAFSIIPTSTGAAKAIGAVLPQLKGKMDGLAIRVPTITASLVDLTVALQKDVTLAQIHQVLAQSTNESFAYLQDPIVSADVIGDEHGSLFDPYLSMVLQNKAGKQFKLFAWYDNESSYVAQYVRVVKYLVSLNQL